MIAMTMQAMEEFNRLDRIRGQLGRPVSNRKLIRYDIAFGSVGSDSVYGCIDSQARRLENIVIPSDYSKAAVNSLAGQSATCQAGQYESIPPSVRYCQFSGLDATCDHFSRLTAWLAGQSRIRANF
jgi:hypothetical protein